MEWSKNLQKQNWASESSRTTPTLPEGLQLEMAYFPFVVPEESWIEPAKKPGQRLSHWQINSRNATHLHFQSVLDA